MKLYTILIGKTELLSGGVSGRGISSCVNVPLHRQNVKNGQENDKKRLIY